MDSRNRRITSILKPTGNKFINVGLFAPRSLRSPHYFTKRSTAVSFFEPNNRQQIMMKRCRTRDDFKSQRLVAHPDISIPGVRKLFHPQLGFWRKLFWLSAIVFCGGICISQLSDRLMTYFGYPVVVDVSVTRNQSIRFPAMTLCPAHFYIDLKLWLVQLKEQACRKKEFSNETFCLAENIPRWRPTFQELNTTFEELWRVMTFPNKAVVAEIPSILRYDTFTRNAAKSPITSKPLYTIWGPCRVIALTTTLDYKGPNTYVNFHMNDSLLYQSSALANVQTKTQFFLHSDKASQRHDAFFLVHTNYHGYVTNVRISKKEFKVLNTYDNPCLDEAVATRCRNACIDRRLSRILNCSMPFIDHSSLPPCRSFQEALRSIQEAHSFYNKMKISDCSCGRKCHDEIYNMELDIFRSAGAGRTKLHLFYGDNMHEIVKEVYTYTLPALLSDVSGNLGFFLGVSLLSILEFLEGLLEKGRMAWQERLKTKRRKRIPNK